MPTNTFEILIYNTAGQLVLTQKASLEIDATNLAKGFYIIDIETQNEGIKYVLNGLKN